MGGWVALRGHGIGWWPRVRSQALHTGALLCLILKGPGLGLPSGIPAERRDKASGPRRCSALFRGRSEAPQLHFVQAFPVFKVVVKMLH